MRQRVELEYSDIKSLLKGGELTIGVGGASIVISYGRTYAKNGAVPKAVLKKRAYNKKYALRKKKEAAAKATKSDK